LGIAHRTVSIKFARNQKKSPSAKPLPESIQTIGDWIQAKRIEKNLNPGHVAAKMGIAASVVSLWEDGTSQPDDRQLKVLENLLAVETGCNASFVPARGEKPPQT
jgi:ribosome-binding protein aMBF1 (putative translation factor)